MIIDLLKNFDIYKRIHPDFSLAFEFIRSASQYSLPTGRHDIESDGTFALIQEYQTRQPDQVVWEAHRRCIDIQYVASGQETMFWSSRGSLAPFGEYETLTDAQKYLDGPGSPLHLPAGTFAVFFPDDLHKPCCIMDESCWVRKIVVKVQVMDDESGSFVRR